MNDSTSFCLIPLSGKKGEGKFVKVSPEDYRRLARHRWYLASDDGEYAFRWKRKHGKVYGIWMHRVVAGTPRYLEGDHKNGDRLDNRRSNLRNCTRLHNRRNTRTTYGKSKFVGVSYRADKRKWRAYASVAGKAIHIGYFDTEIAAAKARDVAVKTLYEGYAYLNGVE